MKKIITILAITTTLSLASASIDTNLKYGMKSPEVSELQEFLVDKGFLTTSPSGFFGLLTLKAVKAYQLSESLPNSGFVGQMTRAKINEALLKETVSSTEAEVQETGTTTPVVIPTPVVYYYPMPTPSVIEPVAKVIEQNYFLGFKNLRVSNDPNGLQVAFSFTPVATLNGYPIEVRRCWTTLFGESMPSKLFKNNVHDGRLIGEDMVIFPFGTPSIVNSLNKGEANTFSCMLVNGKVLSY